MLATIGEMVRKPLRRRHQQLISREVGSLKSVQFKTALVLRESISSKYYKLQNSNDFLCYTFSTNFREAQKEDFERKHRRIQSKLDFSEKEKDAIENSRRAMEEELRKLRRYFHCVITDVGRLICMSASQHQRAHTYLILNMCSKTFIRVLRRFFRNHTSLGNKLPRYEPILIFCSFFT